MLVQKSFHLVGAHEGKTIVLNQFHFVEGQFVWEGPASPDGENIERYLAQWGAFTGETLEAKRAEVALAIENGERPTPTVDPIAEADKDNVNVMRDPLDVPEVAEEPVVTDNGGETEKPETITEALSLLDPATDTDWTGQGLPSVDAVAALLGVKVTRKEIEEAAPGFKRPA